MTCHRFYIVNCNIKRIIFTNHIMESFLENFSQQTSQKKQLLLQKRLKAKQKTLANPVVKVPNKLDVRKERNRCAAQKSRDKKKQYLQNLQEQNMRLKDIISRCEVCSAEHSLHVDTYSNFMQKEEDQIIPITQSPPTFINESDRFIRQDHFNEDSSSHFSKYIWLGCLVLLFCMANLPLNDKNDQRQLYQTDLTTFQKPIIQNYLDPKKIVNTTQSPFMNKSTTFALMSKEQINYCRKCLECLKNITNQTHGELSLLSNLSNESIATNSTTQSKILFCKSKAKFFLKIYEALMNPSDKSQKNSRQITKMLVKGKALNELMQEDCFIGQKLNQEQQYIVSFTLAILEIAPVKVNKINRLSSHSE